VHSGELKWYYQEVKHDVCDYDAVSNVVLFDVHQNGAVIPAAAEAGKVGWVFIVDRRTGQSNVAPGGIQDGPFVALDVQTGKIAWQYKAPQRRLTDRRAARIRDSPRFHRCRIP
jgi:glucose dehydrogenase